MPVIAVINRKGGSGKSTLATHLAAYCAATGKRVMLGDVDRQQSAQTWLKLRAAQKLPANRAIQGWTIDPKNVLRAPAGVTHMVLDTPGGMRGFELARIVMSADAILMPVCNSVFDRESAAECFAELKALPRVASGRCKVAAIGMRLDARTKADAVLAEWARKLDLPFIGVLRETQAYVRCIENGLTLFDMPKSQVQADLAQWKPIAAWLDETLRAPQGAPAQRSASPATPAAVTKAHPAQAMQPPAKALPAQLLAATATSGAVDDAERAAPKPVARVERAPQGELAHAGTLASIGELARALKSADPQQSTAMPARTSWPSKPDPADRPAVPLRPTRPIVSPSGRSPLAATRNATAPGTPRQPAAQGMPAPTPDSSAHASPAAPESAPHGARSRPATTHRDAARPALATRLGQLLEALPIPRFLQRNS